jgi:Glycosyltransferase family 87
VFLFAAFAVVRPLVAIGAYYGPRLQAGGYSYTWLVLAAFAPYIAALWTARQDEGSSLGAVAWVAGAVWAMLAVAPLIQSQDLFQYLFYGRMQVVHGANPYVVAPDAFRRDPWFRWIDWRGQRSVYGPIWMGAMALIVAAAGGSVLRAMLFAKWLAAGLGALAAVAIVRLGSTDPTSTETSRRPTAMLAAFALNPLVLSAVPLSGHADAAVAAALVWAVVCDRRGRTVVSAVLLCAAALVKAYAGLALIAYLLALRRRDGRATAARAAAAAGALAVIGFVPYWHGFGTFGTLAAMAGQASASLAGDVITVATRTLSVLDVREAGEVAGAAVRVTGAALVIGALAFVAFGRRRDLDPWPAVLTVMSVYLLVATWFLPWHAVGALALGCAMPGSVLADPSLVFSGSCLASVRAPGLLGPLVTSAVRYGSPTVAYARRRSSRAAIHVR